MRCMGVLLLATAALALAPGAGACTVAPDPLVVDAGAAVVRVSGPCPPAQEGSVYVEALGTVLVDEQL